MAIIRITLPQDFDERYKKYRGKLDDRKMPEPFLADRLEGEREHLVLINDEEEYQHEVNKWTPLKVIVDAIYKGEQNPVMRRRRDSIFLWKITEKSPRLLFESHPDIIN